MLTRVRCQRLLSATIRWGPKQQTGPGTRRCVRYSSNSSSGGWGQQTPPWGSGGGGGWTKSRAPFLRRATRSRRFRDWVPLHWLVVAILRTVDFGLAAYEVETGNVDELLQRCRFHIATATAENAANLASLHDLLDLVHDSTLSFGPNFLPKLLDAGVVTVALSGAESPNADVSALCYRILALLSQNRHVAQRMADEPALRAVVVGELRRQFSGWSHKEGDDSLVEEDEHGFSGPLGVVGGRGAGSKPGLAARPRGYTDGEKGDGMRPPEVGIVVDVVHFTLALKTLRNVMRGSRRGRGGNDTVGDGGGADRSVRGAGVEEEQVEIPWPLRVLYGEDNYHTAGGADGRVYEPGTGEGRSSTPGLWPLDRKLVADIAEIMLSAAALRDLEAGMAHDEDAIPGKVLEAVAASTLREISNHPPLVGLLFRRRTLAGLVAVSQDSIMANPASRECVINICREYRRLHGLPEPTEPKLTQEAVDAWVDKALGEEWEGSPSGDVSGWEADQAFVRQAERSTLPSVPSFSALLKQLMCVHAVAVGVPWGVGRRWIAWRRAGETFSAVSRFALPRALLWAGLKAGLGAAALVATHGPVGFLPQALPWVLDAASGKRGTLAMNAARETAELGYLYAILRLCPYSFVPSLFISVLTQAGTPSEWSN